MTKFGTLALGAVTGVFLAGSASAFTLFTDQALYEAEIASIGTIPVVNESFTGNVVSSPDLSILDSFVMNNDRVQGVAGNGTAAIQSTTFQFVSSLLGFSATLGNFGSGEDADVFVDGVFAGAISGTGAPSSTTFFGLTIDSGDSAFTSVEFRDDDGNAIFFLDDLVAVAAVPVPAGAVLLITALGGFGALRRRGTAASQA